MYKGVKIINWDFTTLNNSVINYLPKCTYHLLYSCQKGGEGSMGLWVGLLVTPGKERGVPNNNLMAL